MPRYILFYKPHGVLSQFTDEGTGHATLKNYIDIPNVYAAGRLDLDSEGLLLLTDDGGLIRRLSQPDAHTPKTYWVIVEGAPTRQILERLEEGVLIHGRRTLRCSAKVIEEPNLPPRAKPITPHGPIAWIEIKLTEGKKHQIRHMTAGVGLPALRIVRVAIGNVTIKGLRPGDWRDLTPEEVQGLFLQK